METSTESDPTFSPPEDKDPDQPRLTNIRKRQYGLAPDESLSPRELVELDELSRKEKGALTEEELGRLNYLRHRALREKLDEEDLTPQERQNLKDLQERQDVETPRPIK